MLPVRAVVLVTVADPASAARRPGRRPRGVVGGGLLAQEDEAVSGDHRRLRARHR